MTSSYTSEKQSDRYLYFLEELVLSSEREHDTYVYVDLLFALGWHIIRTGAQTEDGRWRCKILGYRMAGSLFDCSEVVAAANKYERKKDKKKKEEGRKGQQLQNSQIRTQLYDNPISCTFTPCPLSVPQFG